MDDLNKVVDYLVLELASHNGGQLKMQQEKLEQA